MSAPHFSTRRHRLKRLAISILLFSLVAWVGLAFGFWVFQKHYRDFTTVKFLSILFPSNWEDYRSDKSLFYVTHGASLVQKGRLQEALQYLAAGTTNSSPPSNSGRILLAELYLAGKRPELANKLLASRFSARHHDQSYVESCLRLLTQLGEDQTILQIANESWTAHAPPPPTSNALIASAAVSAALNLGDYAQAKRIAACHLSHDAEITTCMLARIEWETSHPELATARLRHHLAAHPSHDQAHFALINYFRALKRFAQWETAVIEHVIANPSAPIARINYIQLHRHHSNRAREDKEIDAYLSDFKADAHALLLLADYAVQTAQPNLAKRVESSLSNHLTSARVAALLVIESQLAAEDYAPALDLIADFSRDFPDWAAHYASIFHGFRAIAFSALNKQAEARAEATALASQKNLRPETLLSISDQLAALRAPDLSRMLLRRTLETDAQNHTAHLKLIQLELDTGNTTALPALLAGLPAALKPPRDLLYNVYVTLGRDQFLFTPQQEESLSKTRRALAVAPSQR